MIIHRPLPSIPFEVARVRARRARPRRVAGRAPGHRPVADAGRNLRAARRPHRLCSTGSPISTPRSPTPGARPPHPVPAPARPPRRGADLRNSRFFRASLYPDCGIAMSARSLRAALAHRPSGPARDHRFRRRSAGPDHAHRQQRPPPARPRGHPIDALPGLFSPAAFLRALEAAEAPARATARLDGSRRRTWLGRWHAGRAAAILRGVARRARRNVRLAPRSRDAAALEAASDWPRLASLRLDEALPNLASRRVIDSRFPPTRARRARWRSPSSPSSGRSSITWCRSPATWRRTRCATSGSCIAACTALRRRPPRRRRAGPRRVGLRRPVPHAARRRVARPPIAHVRRNLTQRGCLRRASTARATSAARTTSAPAPAPLCERAGTGAREAAVRTHRHQHRARGRSTCGTSEGSAVPFAG